jgi:hypothetical protein
MGTLKEDIDDAAEWIATALSSSGYAADFTPRSLWEIDRFFDDHSHDGAPRPGGLLSEGLGSRVFALGGYVGEVIRRALGGTWVVDDESAGDAEIEIQFRLDDGSIIWPVQRVMKRYKLGPEEGIGDYGFALGLDVGPKPTSRPLPPPSHKAKPWWRIW